MGTQQKLDKILQQFKDEVVKRHIDFNPTFVHFYIHLLSRDSNEGLDLEHPSECKITKFMELAVSKFANHLDPMLCNMKITFLFEKLSCELRFDFFKDEFTQNMKKKMQPLIDGILQYPETSSEGQIEEMFIKIQAFIVASYCLGSPKNHVLLKQTRQSLNSVISRGDLRNYVLKLKPNRTEYLQRLAATVCGILVYNNHGPDGDKENMRDIIVDLEMAKKNTFESLNSSLKTCLECKQFGFNAITEIIELDASKKKARCHFPMQKVFRINRFVALFCVYERVLRTLLEDIYHKTEHSIEVAENKMKCITSKIDDVLKYRTAIDSELIFPHFVQLSEIWSELVLCLNHLTEINKSKYQLDEIMTPEVNAVFVELIETTQISSIQMKYTVEPTFDQLVGRLGKRTGKGSLENVAEHLKCYCAVTIVLTGGLLVPSTVQKKLCEDLNLEFGFANLELAKYAERNFQEFVCMLQSVISTSVDLLLLFNLHNEILRQDFDEIYDDIKEKTRTMETQTELVLENLSKANQSSITWNIWDNHRETIRLANLRRRQTHSAQTVVTYGRRSAQNQANEHGRNF